MPSRSAWTPASACSRSSGMIDPELTWVLDAMPVFDLDDPVAARRDFESLIEGLHLEIPESFRLELEDRTVPGWEGEPDVVVRIYRPREAVDGAVVPGILAIHG